MDKCDEYDYSHPPLPVHAQEAGFYGQQLNQAQQRQQHLDREAITPEVDAAMHERISRPTADAASAGALHKTDGEKSPSPSYLTAAKVCLEAARLVGGDRAATHGDKSINFLNTADAWNAILRAKARRVGYPTPVALEALDVANMLEAFKIARRYSGSYNPDDYVDGAGYAGCGAEIAAKENSQ